MPQKKERVLCVKKYYLYEGEYKQTFKNKKEEEFNIIEKVVGYVNTSNPTEYFTGSRFGRTTLYTRKGLQYICYCNPIVLDLDAFNECVTITKELGKMI